MTLHLLAASRENPGGKKPKIVRRVYRKPKTTRRPFHQTRFGRLPPEIREKIFIELVADPPSYAGHDTLSPELIKSPTAPKRFVHIKGSCYQVTGTCRQIYLESHHLFFAAKAYYLENTEELSRFLGPRYLRAFRYDTITALCLKNLMKEKLLFTAEQVEIALSRTNAQLNARRRQYLETTTYKTFDFEACFKAKQLKNLRKVGLCMKVGEEMLHIDLLYFLSGMRRGLVEFVDASRWLIRPQNPEDVWSIQYACFRHGDYLRGKYNGLISYDSMSIIKAVTDIDSRAPGLQQGGERYVEAQIQLPMEEISAVEPADSDEGDRDRGSASTHSEMNLSVHDSDEDSLEEVSTDEYEADTQSETSENDNLLPGIESGSNLDEYENDTQLESSVIDHLLPGTDSGSNVIEESPFLGLQDEDGQTTQEATNTDQEENQDSLQTTGEDVFDTQLIAPNDNPVQELHSAQASLELPPATMSDPLQLDEVDREDDQVQNDTRISDQAAQVSDSQPDDGILAGRNAEEHNSKDKVKEGTRLRSIYRSRTSRMALSAISVPPNPYTEEELESYENWLQPASEGDRRAANRDSHQKEQTSSPSEKLQDQHVKTLVAKNEGSMVVSSQHLAELIVRSVQTGALFLLFLILVLIPEKFSNAS